MKRFPPALIVLGCAVVFFSCASQKRIAKAPPPNFEKIVMAKDIDESGMLGIPVEPTTDFTSEDQQVTALINLENMSGSHNIRWEWVTPDGQMYLATDNHPLAVSEGNYLPKLSAWHSISLKDDPAANIHGQWTVHIYVDDEWVDSKPFTVASAILDPLLLPAGVASKPYPKDWGLIIGIEEYNRLPSVEYARKDALIVRDYFNHVLGVPEENIISLIDADATKSSIEGYLKTYIPKNVGKDATLYVYFAGHGMPGLTKGEPYLVPYDADTRFIDQTGYRLITFYQDLQALEVDKVYVFLDSCFSGVASRAAEMLVKGARPALIHVENVKPATSSIVSFNATSTGEISNAFPEKEHGLFTYYLLRGLRGEADQDDDGWSSIKEIYGYVRKNVTRESRRMQSEQTPIIVPSADVMKDVGFSRNLLR